MILPTVAMAVYLTYLSRNDRKELLHNFAVTCWILANSVWMIGEFFFNDSTRIFAAVLFVIGLISVSIYYIGLLIKLRIYLPGGRQGIDLPDDDRELPSQAADN